MSLGGQLVGPILEILEIFGPVISVMDIWLVLSASYKCHGHIAGPSCQLQVSWTYGWSFVPVISVMDIWLVLRASYKCHGHMAGPSCQLCVCVCVCVCVCLYVCLPFSFHAVISFFEGNKMADKG